MDNKSFPSSRIRRILDLLLFNGELDMLELRLAEHYPYIDQFIIVESKKTFSNRDKILYFDSNRSRYEKYSSKIKYLVIEEDDVFESAWDRETFYRNYAIKEIVKYNPNDIVINLDLDEILSRSILKMIKVLEKTKRICP